MRGKSCYGDSRCLLDATKVLITMVTVIFRAIKVKRARDTFQINACVVLISVYVCRICVLVMSEIFFSLLYFTMKRDVFCYGNNFTISVSLFHSFSFASVMFN